MPDKPVDYRFCYLVAENGQHNLYTGDGKKIEGLQFTRTYDGCGGEVSYCIARLVVTIATQEEMKQHIEEGKQKEAKKDKADWWN